MEVTVIMPVYNCAKTLHMSISSVLSQTYQNIEFIIVDDGSSDESLEICKSYALHDSRIKVFHQQNAGPSAARNYGISKADSKYIMFIDADDTYELNMIETMVKTIEKSGVDLVICGLKVINELNNKQKINEVFFHSNFCYKNKKDILNNVQSLLNSGLFNCIYNKLYKTSLIKNNNIKMDECLDIGEDLQFNLLYLEQTNSIEVIKYAFYNYHKSNSFLSKKYRENIFEIRKLPLERLSSFFLKNDIDSNIINFLYLKLAFACFMQLFHEENGKNKVENYKYIRSILNKKEVINAVSIVKPRGLFQILLVMIIKSKSITIIYFVSKLMNFIRENNILRIKRISV